MFKFIYRNIIIVLALFALNSLVFSQVVNHDQNILDDINSLNHHGMIFYIAETHRSIANNSELAKEFHSVETIDDMKYYLDLDFFAYLMDSLNMEISLDQLLFDMSDLLEDVISQKEYLENNMFETQQKMNECIELKSYSDKMFWDSLNDLNIKDMNYYLDLSYKNEECIWQNRIKYNVNDKLMKQTDFYLNVFRKKYLNLYNNRDNIINYYPNIVNFLEE